MYCKRCGTELRESDEFCYHCGNRTTVFQRVLASRAFVGSILAVLFVIAAGILTYLILTGKIKLPSKGKEPVTQEQQQKPSSNKKKTGTKTAVPTETPYVFEAREISVKQAEKQWKKLFERAKPFLCYSAPFYGREGKKFAWNDSFATTMALYNLEHQDQTVRSGMDMETIGKAVRKEMKKLFGSKRKYTFQYEEKYPQSVYRPAGNTIVFQSVRIPGKEYVLKCKRAVEYEEAKYQVVVEAELKVRGSAERGDVQKYTMFLKEQAGSKFGYIIEKIRLFKKSDMK